MGLGHYLVLLLLLRNVCGVADVVTESIGVVLTPCLYSATSKQETQCGCVELFRLAQGSPDPVISYWGGHYSEMAAQAKNTREVKKEELQACIEEANEALENAKEQRMRTNVLRTLQTRKNRLSVSYEEWNRACHDYSTKVAATIMPDEKQKDTGDNVKPVRKSYIETLDALNDIIEEKVSQESSVHQKQTRKTELETQIERECKDIDTKILNHKNRSCLTELSRGAKERLYKEMDRDVNEPIETVRKLFLELFPLVTEKIEAENLSQQEEKWMDSITKSLMVISDKYTSIPEIGVPGDGLNVSNVSSQSLGRASLKVKKADPPRFDGKIPSYPRFKKDFQKLMQDYDDSSQVYYIRNSSISEDKNLIKTLDTMTEVWSVLDKRYKHSEVGANSLLESFGDIKTPPSSAHTQFTAVFLKYKELKDGLDSLEEMQYLKCNPAFRRVLLSKLPARIRERFLEREARKRGEKEEKGDPFDRFEFMDEFMEYQFKISMSVESVTVDRNEEEKRPKCFICGSVDHRKKDCPKQRPGGAASVRKFNAATASPSTVSVLPCRCCGLKHVNPYTSKQFTRLSKCDKFRNMDLQNRVKELERLKACALCLDSSGDHQREKCTAKTKGGELFRSCSMIDNSGNKCNKKHNPWVHGGASSYINMVHNTGSNTEVLPTIMEVEDESESTDSSDSNIVTADDTFGNSTTLAQAGIADIVDEADGAESDVNDESLDGPGGTAPVADEQVLLLMQFVPCRAGYQNISTLTFWDHG